MQTTWIEGRQPGLRWMSQLTVGFAMAGALVAGLGCSDTKDPAGGGSSSGGTTGSGGQQQGGGGSGGGDMTPGNLEDFVPAEGRFMLTSKAGAKLEEQGKLQFEAASVGRPTIRVDLTKVRQEIIGFGGSFTESSAAVLNQLPAEKRLEVINAYFGEDGAHYSLTRTHIGACDFSFGKYSYAPEEDATLSNFSIDEDRDDLIPLIKDAMNAPGADFKIMASPWTAPPWMKTLEDWFEPPSADNGFAGTGGKLKPAHYSTFALYFAKYIQAYKEEGIDIWAVTPENEPLGNSGQWESMEFSPEEMRTFIRDHLGPTFAEEGLDTEIYIFDQNREEAEEWVDVIMGDPETKKYVHGTALHWYGSTFRVFEDVLDRLHEAHPDMKLLNSEATIDAIRDHALEQDPPEAYNAPRPGPPWGELTGELNYWKNDAWWWEKNATDWGYYWAQNKSNHPIYEPVFRYARDILVGLNHWFVGWIDWNLVLNERGGPNHVGNWCMAPVMIDTEAEDIYYTPNYYVMSHFSKYIRPGARVLGVDVDSELELLSTAATNPDGTISVVVLNLGESQVDYALEIGGRQVPAFIPGPGLQTVIVTP